MKEAYRPSGATLCVVKKFLSQEDFEKQLLLMRAAKGPGLKVAVPNPELLEFRMPLARPIGPEHAMDLVATYQWLWSLTNPRPYCSLHDYSTYVYSRPTPQSAEALFNRARGVVEALGDTPGVRGPDAYTMVGFVHGDATASNAVSTEAGVRLIDFSPRPTPAYAELDIAKLIFSALGFDTDPALGTALLSALGFHPDSKSLYTLPPLTRYFLATHVVRVMSKEPPETLERVGFYQRVLNILENQQ